jgi:hypothetical protein
MLEKLKEECRRLYLKASARSIYAAYAILNDETSTFKALREICGENGFK